AGYRNTRRGFVVVLTTRRLRELQREQRVNRGQKNRGQTPIFSHPVLDRSFSPPGGWRWRSASTPRSTSCSSCEGCACDGYLLYLDLKTIHPRFGEPSCPRRSSTSPGTRGRRASRARACRGCP